MQVVEEQAQKTKEINQNAVSSALKTVLESGLISQDEGISFSFNSADGEMQMIYLKERLDERSFRILTGVFDPRKTQVVASRIYTFYEKQEEVSIESYSDTKKNYESRGYGSALIEDSNEVIESAISYFPELKGKTVKAIIVDSAKGKGSVSREGWSSHQAEKLGYANVGDGKWEKIYQQALK